MTVLVTGATGFVGRRVVQTLLDQGNPVRCLVRTPAAAAVLDPDRVDIHFGDVSDSASLTSAFNGVDAVVHLVAVIREKGSATFDAINFQGARNVAEAASVAGVNRLVHVSAIGAQDNPRFPYLHSKWRGERATAEAGVPYTIVRPSIVFGPSDEFLSTLAALVKAFPAVPVLGNGRTRFQPIHVDDVARCITQSLDRPDLAGNTLGVGGPQHLTYDQILDAVVATLRSRRVKLHMPLALVRPLLSIMQAILPNPPATRHQLDMLSLDNVCDLDSVHRHFGFSPRPLHGNIDFVRDFTRIDGLKLAVGISPRRHTSQ